MKKRLDQARDILLVIMFLITLALGVRIVSKVNHNAATDCQRKGREEFVSDIFSTKKSVHVYTETNDGMLLSKRIGESTVLLKLYKAKPKGSD